MNCLLSDLHLRFVNQKVIKCNVNVATFLFLMDQNKRQILSIFGHH